jgi:hypothetical protein
LPFQQYSPFIRLSTFLFINIPAFRRGFPQRSFVFNNIPVLIVQKKEFFPNRWPVSRVDRSGAICDGSLSNTGHSGEKLALSLPKGGNPFGKPQEARHLRAGFLPPWRDGNDRDLRADSCPLTGMTGVPAGTPHLSHTLEQ